MPTETKPEFPQPNNGNLCWHGYRGSNLCQTLVVPKKAIKAQKCWGFHASLGKGTVLLLVMLNVPLGNIEG